MKKVILKSLTLVNFKGEKERTTGFNPGVTTISGDNGLGKSRHFDAFIWLLFGKDAQDRKDYEVKTRINGEELHKAECSVAGTLEVDGEAIALKRAFVEDWVKPRGQAEQRFKGNRTECWWNGTPVNVTEYDRRVRGIVDSSVFKMITNPAFFANMDWRLQREQLFQLAGAPDDSEIAAKSPEFAALLDRISGKPLADFKAEIAAKKRRLKGELEQIQPRIDQTIKMKPESEDFAALEKELAGTDREIADVDESISDAMAAVRKSYEAEQARQKAINALKYELQSIELNARKAAAKKAFDLNAERRELEGGIDSRNGELERLKNGIRANEFEIERCGGRIRQMKDMQDALRRAWSTENARQYAGDAVCPHCGQRLPDEMIAEARKIFADAKLKKCGQITEQGRAYGQQIESEEKAAGRLKAENEQERAKAGGLAAEIARMRARLESMPEAEEESVDFASIPEWAEKKAEIERTEAAAPESASPAGTSALQLQKKGLNDRRNGIVARLAKREQIERADREVADLEERGRDLGQQIADCERDEYAIKEFTKAKIDDCERRINGLFRFVSFRLYDYTIDGNPVETCVPLIGGVPYGSANRASQVNAGLDIINALCRYYGVSAPIFIDNAESVNSYMETESQTVFLRVTDDKALTIK